MEFSADLDARRKFGLYEHFFRREMPKDIKFTLRYKNEEYNYSMMPDIILSIEKAAGLKKLVKNIRGFYNNENLPIKFKNLSDKKEFDYTGVEDADLLGWFKSALSKQRKS
jgi:hypothetical protein